MNKMVVGLSAALSFIVASGSAVAQQAVAPAQQQQNAKKAPDPNEVVCEKQQDSSSRLVMNKVCMTRSQWAEQRRMDRQDIDKIQTQRGCTNGC